MHLCRTKEGSSGSPILDLDTNCEIGIHNKSYKNENDKKKDFNGGIFLQNAIEEFEKGKNFISLKDENIPYFKNLISELTIQHNFIPKNINYFENEEKKEEERVEEEDEKLKNNKKKN